MTESEIIAELKEIRKVLVNIQSQVGPISGGIQLKLGGIEALLKEIVKETSSRKLQETYGSPIKK